MSMGDLSYKPPKVKCPFRGDFCYFSECPFYLKDKEDCSMALMVKALLKQIE